MTLPNDVKKALQTLRKDVDEAPSYVAWLLDELERHLGLKTEAPAPAPAPAPVAPPEPPAVDELAQASPAEEPGAPNSGSRPW